MDSSFFNTNPWQLFFSASNPWLEMLRLQCEINSSAIDSRDRRNAGIFPTETVLNCNVLPRPANYTLERVFGENDVEGDTVFVAGAPAAGRVPGIAAQHPESQIGQLLKLGEVYWIIHGKEPHPDQTFLSMIESTVADFHYLQKKFPDKEIISVSDCQHGWAAMIAKLLDAARNPDSQMLDGIYVGSPLSFWGGDPGKHSIRFLSTGIGSLFARFMSDVNGGTFDAAWNSFNFALYNLAHTLSGKLQRDFNHRNDPAKKNAMLIFAKWLKSFHKSSKDQMVKTLDELFIGNKLELNQLFLDGQLISFSNLTGTHVFVASDGDDISDLYATWGWILNFFASDEQIKNQNARIFLMNIPGKGHLAIFSSVTVAKKYIHPLAAGFQSLREHEPGLYTLSPQPDGQLATEPIALDELRAILHNHNRDHALHARISAKSEMMGQVYETFYSPWVRAVANPLLSKFLHDFHPMRFWRDRYTTRSPIYQVACTLDSSREKNPLWDSSLSTSLKLVGLAADTMEKFSTLSREIFARTFC